MLLTIGCAVSSETTSNRVPVLLELFTSEGCSSCPPADRLLERFDREQPFPGAELIVLSEHVDYWNSLGWSDPYSSAAFSRRQRDYAARLGLEDVYTPQLIVDGKTGFVGSDANKAATVISSALASPKASLQISIAGQDAKSAQIRVSSSGQISGDLFVAAALDRAQSHVSSGENSGRTLGHVAVVYSLQKGGKWNGSGSHSQELDVPLKASAGHARIVAFVQDPGSGKIVAVSQTRL